MSYLNQIWPLNSKHKQERQQQQTQQQCFSVLGLAKGTQGMSDLFGRGRGLSWSFLFPCEQMFAYFSSDSRSEQVERVL